MPPGAVELTRRAFECVGRVLYRGVQPWPNGWKTFRRWFGANQERFLFERDVARAPIHCDISDVPLEVALKQILQPLGLTIAIRDEAIWITTAENEELELTAAVYDVRDLVQIYRPPQGDDSADEFCYPDIGFYPHGEQRTPGQWMAFGRWSASAVRSVELDELVVELVDPSSWNENGRSGHAEICNDLLIIYQTRGGHAQVRQLLEFLRCEAKHLPQPMDLANQPSQQDIEALFEYLDKVEDPRKLAYVLYLIQRSRPPSENTVPALMDALSKLDPIDDAAKHERLVRALGSYGRLAEKAVPLLVERWPMLPNSQRNLVTIRSIGNLGPAAVPFLCEILKTEEKDWVLTACDCLQQMGPDAKAAVEPLLESLNEDKVQNRAAAAALVAIDPNGALSRRTVARWVTDPDRRVRKRAAKAEEHVQAIFGDPY
jgi:hypothetical protein